MTFILKKITTSIESSAISYEGYIEGSYQESIKLRLEFIII